MNEFELIDTLFKPCSISRKDVLLGIGDDAACVSVPHGHDLLISTDTLVSGVHFLPHWDAYDVACRAVNVNVSDMAAMGGEPRWMTVALTMPEKDISWMSRFAQGLKDSLSQYHVDVVGGDTTRGPLCITPTILGTVPHNQAVKRKGAQVGDVVFVSGPLGAAALAVEMISDKSGCSSKDHAVLLDHLMHPKARVDLIDCLRAYASAAIDVSDGLSADLNHLCVASGVGAALLEAQVPIHPLVSRYCPDRAMDLALTGGDDYELCFTIKAPVVDAFLKDISRLGLTCYPIGTIEQEQGLRMITKGNERCSLIPGGYAHF